MTTFGALIERALGDEIAGQTRKLIEWTVGDADRIGKQHLRVVSCHTCTAPKGCCSLITTAFLHEGAVIAGRLRRDGRDTPELRARLRKAAEAMENSTPERPYQTPCVFLDGAERCTVYEVRPMECGVRLVYSPPEACSTPGAEVELHDARAAGATAMRVAERFRDALGLPPLAGGRFYAGPMPRMVLVALQTWEREDYVKALGKRDWPAPPR